MLFNGKYYNKPGHLGMTRQQLKEALAGGGGGDGVGVIKIIDDGTYTRSELTVADVVSLFNSKPCVGYVNIPGTIVGNYMVLDCDNSYLLLYGLDLSDPDTPVLVNFTTMTIDGNKYFVPED